MIKVSTQLLKESQLKEAAQIILNGGIVAFRTETVYGLGADATNESAVQKIFDAKSRPAVNPLIVHFNSCKHAVNFFGNLGEEEIKFLQMIDKLKLALTIIVPREKKLPTIVSGGLDTVAVRIPACKFARKFIKACGVPIAAPSANTSGRPSPTTWSAVYEDLDGKIDAILAGSPTQIGVESTVVRSVNNKIQVLRLGGCSTEQLSKLTTMPIEIVTDKTQTAVSPGTRFCHYAPRIPMYLINNKDEVNDFIKKHQDKKIAILYRKQNENKYIKLPNVKLFSLGNNAKQITQRLFTKLRQSEKQSDLILCEQFENTPEFEAINERIHRACERKTLL